MKALIVEDDYGVRFGNSILAQSKGYETTQIDNYDDAIEIIKKERFDAYLIDGYFPNSKNDRNLFLNGPMLYEFIQNLYADANILLITAESDVVRAAKEKGWKAYIKGESFNKEF